MSQMASVKMHGIVNLIRKGEDTFSTVDFHFNPPTLTCSSFPREQRAQFSRHKSIGHCILVNNTGAQ